MPSVGRELESRGIIKARALYNKQSADYRALIDAWRLHLKPESRADVDSKPSAPRPAHRTAASVVNAGALDILKVAQAAERASTKRREVENLKQLAAMARKLEPVKLVGRPLKNASDWKLKPEDWAAVEDWYHAMTADSLKEMGLHRERGGDVYNEKGTLIIGPRFVNAIRKILANEAAKKSKAKTPGK